MTTDFANCSVLMIYVWFINPISNVEGGIFIKRTDDLSNDRGINFPTVGEVCG
jgi:hypothetical protein